MRLAGFDERLVTGDADPWDRFSAWAATVPRLIRNPLYVWSHLELRRVFGIDLELNPSTAREIWEEANRQLPGWSTPHAARAVQRESGRDHRRPGRRPRTPTETLPSGPAGRGDRDDPHVPPRRRPRLLGDPSAWNQWVDRLESGDGGQRSTDLPSLLDALTRSDARFARLGARASDHGLESLPDLPRNPSLADDAVRRARAGGAAGARPSASSVMLEVVRLSRPSSPSRDESVLQLHLGPLRDVSPRLLVHWSGETQAPTPSATTARHRGSPGSSGTSSGTACCRAPSCTTPTPPTTPCSRPWRARSRATACARWCSGDRRGGSTTTSRACDTTSTTCRRSASWPGSSGMHDRLALDPVDDASRALPPRALRRRRTRRRRGPDPGGPRVVLDGGARPLLATPCAYFSLPAAWVG